MSSVADTLEGFAQFFRQYTMETSALWNRENYAAFEIQMVLAEEALASIERVERRLATTTMFLG